MAITNRENAEELVKSYNQMIKKGIAAIETGWEQITAAAKQFAAASQTEMEETGKTWESAINDAQSRNEKMADGFKDPATYPWSGAAGFKPETKELVDQLIEGAKTYSQSWTGYLAGLEKRQVAFLKGLSGTNSKIIESSQDLAKTAAVYGDALLDWSNEAVKRVSTKNGS